MTEMPLGIVVMDSARCRGTLRPTSHAAVLALHAVRAISSTLPVELRDAESSVAKVQQKGRDVRGSRPFRNPLYRRRLEHADDNRPQKQEHQTNRHNLQVTHHGALQFSRHADTRRAGGRRQRGSNRDSLNRLAYCRKKYL